MTRKILLAVPVLFLLFIGPLWAQASAEKHLALEGVIAPNGRAVELSWFDANPPRVGSVIINRRISGQTGAASWKALGPALGPVMRFTDETTRPGVAYEYQVMRTARDIVDVGYWATGVALPAITERGTVHVVVDETLAEALSNHLGRFGRDLTGDGWQVRYLSAPRGDLQDLPRNLQSAATVKAALLERYAQDPFGTHAVVLVGHVPMVLSGQVRPDGHAAEPHVSDLFYAQMDALWSATPEGLLRDNRLPGDAIAMQIGRIDFSTLGGGDTAREVALLRAYFDKNHHWRMGLIGDLRQAYGQSNHLTAEQYGLRNIVGPGAVTPGGHHDVGEAQPWLWGVDFGHYKGSDYAESYANKAVFALNFGSHKQKIQMPFNAMTALLAQPWYPVAVGWGGRPAWWLHPMALGGSIGEVHQRTVNNGMADQPYRETMAYFPTGNYLWRNPIWVNLLGDPTLRAFPLAPPHTVRAMPVEDGVEITWQPSPDADVIGYRIWRASEDSNGFVPLGDGTVQEGLRFLDETPMAPAQYMVRAYGLKDVHAGSFHTFSQGAFAGPGEDLARTIELTARAGTEVALPAAFTAPQDGRIHAFIEGPARGVLTRDTTGWRYTPDTAFTGTVDLRFSVSTLWETHTATLSITFTE